MTRKAAYVAHYLRIPQGHLGGRAVKIHRTRHEANFTILPNAALRDQRLSLRARGLLVELLSRPEDWNTSADAMARTARRDRGKKGEGRDAMRGAFAELEEAGYIVRTRTQNDGGEWSTVLAVYDTPQQQKASSYRGTGNQPSVHQASADQSSEYQASLRSTDGGSTGLRSTDDEESAALADARAGSLASSRARDEDDDQQRQKHTFHAELQRRYDSVDTLAPQQLRTAMLGMEKQRPRIYREARNDALEQLDKDQVRTEPWIVDNLAYKFMILRYMRKQTAAPACIAKPIGAVA